MWNGRETDKKRKKRDIKKNRELQTETHPYKWADGETGTETFIQKQLVQGEKKSFFIGSTSVSLIHSSLKHNPQKTSDTN